MRNDREGLVQLNTGDSFSRVNGVETVVTPQGDTFSLNTRNGAMQLMADGARIQQLNDKTGKFQDVAQLPGSFG